MSGMTAVRLSVVTASGGREHHVDVACDHVLQGGRRALVGNVDDVDLSGRLEQLAGKMGGGAVS
jgi:hypothetical protein